MLGDRFVPAPVSEQATPLYRFQPVRIELSRVTVWRVGAVWRRIDPATPATYAEDEQQLGRGGDRPASLHDQLGWLRKAGLDAICLHAYGNRVVLVGRKPDP